MREQRGLRLDQGRGPHRFRVLRDRVVLFEAHEHLVPGRRRPRQENVPIGVRGGVEVNHPGDEAAAVG